MSFWENLSELCKKRGISPSAAAQAIGLSNAAATYWKHGSEPKLQTLLALCKYFSCEISELIPD